MFNGQLQNLDSISPDACNLLKTLAFLDPETIPLDILVSGAQRVGKEKSVSPAVIKPATGKLSVTQRLVSHLPWKRPKSPAPASHQNTHSGGAPSLTPKLGPLVKLMCSQTGLVMAMNHFEGLSLAQSRYGDNQSLHLHDLNQLILLDQIRVAEQAEEYHAIAATLLASAFETIKDFGSPPSWAECESLVPHLTSLEKHRPPQTPPSRELLNMSQGIARYLHKRGRYNEAEALLIRVLAQREQAAGIGEDHLDTLGTVHALAEVYTALGKYDQADKSFGRALTGREKQIGADHRDTLVTLEQLAYLRYLQSQYDDAEELYARLLEKREVQFGAEHLDTLNALEGLAHVYTKQGKFDDAMPFYERVLAGREKQLGPEHPYTLTAMSNLGSLYREQGKYDQAEPLLARVLRSRETQLGEEHPDTLSVAHHLARLYLDQGKHDEAETLYARVLAGYEKQLGAEHPQALVAVNNFAVLRESQGRWAEAEVLYRRALAGMEEALGGDHRETKNTMNCLACLYEEQGRDEEAGALRARFREVEQKA